MVGRMTAQKSLVISTQHSHIVGVCCSMLTMECCRMFQA